jgi:hypothetical protein
VGAGREAVIVTGLQRRTPLARTTPLRRSPLATYTPLQRRTPLKPFSKKRAAEMRVRRALVQALYPDRPMCSVPWCPRFADDIHETLTRARSGGMITDPGLWAPLCRPCHTELTDMPDSELGWAYELNLLVHSWDAPKRGAA